MVANIPMLKGVLFMLCATPLFQNMAGKKWNLQQAVIEDSKRLTSHRNSRCVKTTRQRIIRMHNLRKIQGLFEVWRKGQVEVIEERANRASRGKEVSEVVF